MSDALGSQDAYFEELEEYERRRYSELQDIANKYLKHHVEALLETTFLVHERYQALRTHVDEATALRFFHQQVQKSETAITNIKNLIQDLLYETDLPDNIAQDIANLVKTILESPRVSNDIIQENRRPDLQEQAQKHLQHIKSL